MWMPAPIVPAGSRTESQNLDCIPLQPLAENVLIPLSCMGVGGIAILKTQKIPPIFISKTIQKTAISMLKTIIAHLTSACPAQPVSAHCDGPCGVYDPASARVTAEAVLSMTQKIKALEGEGVAYQNTLSRYIAVKEEQAQKTKEDLLVLWTDYFKPTHLEKYPDLHDTFWKAAKLCSACKVEVSEEHAKELMAAVEKIHGIFWATKGRDVKWELAKPA